MIRIEAATYAESVSCTPISAIGEPSGPMLNGTTYIVWPRIAPRNLSVSSVAHLGGVAPVVRRAGVVLVLRADERAVLDAGHVARVGARQVRVRTLCVREALERARVDERCARRSYSSAEPSHQWIGGRLGELCHLLDPGAAASGWT